MASKHLKQLLDEDQEPFVLKNYIDERRCQLKRPVSKTQLQVKRRKPISENSSFFCKNACFFSFHDSPDVKMSPLFSPVKSPCRNSNTLFVHIPSKTAAILLEAALRIQKQSAAKKPKNPKNIGFGFFGSMLKRITSHRNKKRNNNNNNISGGDNEIKVSVKDILRWDSSNGRKRVAENVDFDENGVSEMGFSCSCNSRVSSAWSESNEEKSMDLETSSSRSEDSIEMDFVDEQMIKNGDFGSYEKEFCSSPFRFVLQNCSSPTGEITPEFMSPVTSPCRLKKQVVKNEEGQLNCVGNELEDEEKEQFSPVSVLDPQFEEDDDDEDDGQEDDGDEKDGFELERSFANVQRARQQLLHKLRRFEQLADLNPIELEKRIAEEEEELEDDDEELYDDDEGEDEDEDEDEVTSDSYKGDSFIREVLSVSNMCNVDHRIPSDMKRLILDLMAEEEEQEECGSSSHDREATMVKKLRKRLDSWMKVESDTIDMMVELDFRSEGDLWRKNKEQVREMAVAIEFDIFSYLVKELSEELVHSSPLY